MNRANDVLVVDDDPDMTEVMVQVLDDAGYATRSAANGQEALDAVAAKMPALILLDMLMPVMDGWECARELRARYGQALPIVVVTAAEQARVRAEQISAEGMLPKPFDINDLLRVVRHHVARSG